MSMIPTSTGATSAVGEVLPALVGKINGSAIRVPTTNVSVVDLVVTTSQVTSLNEVNQAFREAAKGPMMKILGINERPLVSIDFNHDPHSSVVDLTQTNVADKRFVRVLAWYDNEWGFSCRMLDTAAAMAKYL
jgi:glyceraldehyde 3-phosphate dehydrogenase